MKWTKEIKWIKFEKAMNRWTTEVAYSLRGYLLYQSKYITNILDQAHLSDTQTKETPLEQNVWYTSYDGVLLSDPTLYCTQLGVSYH